MLERYFIRPETVDRIRSSWIGGAIEQYVTWLTGNFSITPGNSWVDRAQWCRKRQTRWQASCLQTTTPAPAPLGSAPPSLQARSSSPLWWISVANGGI
jgi:hypothetical protein